MVKRLLVYNNYPVLRGSFSDCMPNEKEFCDNCGLEIADYIGKFTGGRFRYFCKKCYDAHERGEI